MSDKNKYPSELAERFQIRLPPGIRDRIKATAEANGRSMNTEIVATLEAEYQEKATLGIDQEFIDRIDSMKEMLDELRAALTQSGLSLSDVEAIRSNLSEETQDRIVTWAEKSKGTETDGGS